MKIRIIVLTFFLGFCLIVKSQDRYAILEQKLIYLSKTSPCLKKKVDLFVNGATIRQFIRTIGVNNNSKTQQISKRA
jgi:hypothetical protein